MEANNTTPLLRCEQVCQLLEEKTAGADKETLRLHLKTCAACRAELRLRVVMAQMLEEPPAELSDSIMNRIRTEQKKTAARLRFIRRAGAVAAAVVLIPAVVILAPILLRTGDAVTSQDDARIEETRAMEKAPALPETTAAAADLSGAFADGVNETPDITSPAAEVPENENYTYSSAAADEPPKVMLSTAPATEAAPIPPAAPAPETIPETAAVSAAPSYVGVKESSSAERQTSPSTMASDVSAAAPQGEEPVYAVLRALVGEKILSTHIASYIGSDADLPAYLCRIFSVTREEFTAQAQNMALSFTPEELDLLFPAES